MSAINSAADDLNERSVLITNIPRHTIKGQGGVKDNQVSARSCDVMEQTYAPCSTASVDHSGKEEIGLESWASVRVYILG